MDDFDKMVDRRLERGQLPDGIEKSTNEDDDGIEVLSDVSREDIIEAMKECLKISPMIQPQPSMINTVLQVLTAQYTKNVPYVIVEAPTGSGKTIIGFMLHFCSVYLYEKINNGKKNLEGTDGRIQSDLPLTYYLTSSKALQEQIELDIQRFNFNDYLMMIKGADNYPCRRASVDECVKKSKNFSYDPENTKTEDLPYVIKYSERPCIGSNNKQRNNVNSKYYCQFNETNCDYHLKRIEAQQKNCVIINYAFFINCMRLEHNPFFVKRKNIICDEAHLIPDICCNIFNYDINPAFLTKLQRLTNSMRKGIGEEQALLDIDYLTRKMFSNLFTKEVTKRNINLISDYIVDYLELEKKILKIQGLKYDPYIVELNRVREQMSTAHDQYEDLSELISLRIEDLYIESSMITYDQITSTAQYKYNIKDLLESTMVRNKFLVNITKGIFMSATLGNIDEFAILMGMNKNEYIGFRLKSTFDFTNSPIIIVKSGYLNYKNFDNVIEKLIADTIKIAESEMHRDQKGIIHTSTFKISEMLALRIVQGSVPDYNRYLFYENSEEKEYKINLMKNSLNIPYVIVGPSLYEGLDLKDDLGRFNILMKVPYSALTGYTKEKSERYPFWYRRNTIEKIIQAMGRTNRSKTDYSTIYLMDSCFDKLIFDLPDEFIERYKTGKFF